MNKKVINCIVFSFLFIILSCSTANSSSVLFKYHGWKDYHSTGVITIQGQINKEEWSLLENDTETKVWQGKLLTFQVRYNRTDKSGDKFSRGPYKFKGFHKNSGNTYYYANIKRASDTPFGYSLYVYVHGFDEQPDALVFSHKTTIKNIAKNNYTEKIGEDNFRISKIKPDRIEFDSFDMDRIQYPRVHLFFNNASLNEPPQKKGNTPGEPVQTEKPVDKPVPSVSSEPEIISLMTKTEKNVGLEFLDKGNIIKATLIWKKPYSKMELPKKIEDYTYIQLMTSFGRCQFDKTDGITKNTLKISDFFRVVKVKVNESILSLYYTKNDKDWILYKLRNINKSPQTITIKLPKMAPDEETKWKLAAVNKGQKIREQELDLKNLFTSKNVPEIDMTLSATSRDRIKTKPPEAIVTITYDNEILFSEKSNKDGLLEIPLYLKPYEKKTIRIEKKGYFYHQSSLQEFLSNTSEPQNVSLTPAQYPEFNEISKSYKIFKKMGGKQENVKIVVKDSNDETVFNNFLENLQFFPDSSTKYQLKYEGYAFNSEKINNTEIKVRPHSKLIEVSVQLFHKTDASTCNESLTDEKATFTIGRTEKKHDQFIDSLYKFTNVEFPINYTKDSSNLSPLEISVSYRGYKTEKSSLDPDKAENGELDIKFVLNAEPPDVVIVISGNRHATGNYFYKSATVVAEIFDDKKMKVFISEQKFLKPVTNKEYLIGYSTANHLDSYINEEINKAFNHLKQQNDESIPSYVIYMAKISSTLRKINKRRNLHIITPNLIQDTWTDKYWHIAETKEQMKDVLSKVLKGEL